MIRTKKANEKPDFIITGDWHLRESSPICRTDDFWKAQWNKVHFIRKLQEKYDCPILHSGDLFDHWKPSPYLLNMAIQHIPQNFDTVCGNHDLPNNSISELYRAGIAVLDVAKIINIDIDGSWNEESWGLIDDGIYMRHIMTYDGSPPWPGCTDPSATELLQQFPDKTLLITGHNHKTFVVRHENSILVNPGSLTRQKADQIDHKPCIFLWYAYSRKLEQVFIPCHKNVISREHIAKIEEKNEKLEAFIQQLKEQWEIGDSFRNSVDRFFNINQIHPTVQSVIRRAMEHE